MAQSSSGEASSGEASAAAPSQPKLFVQNVLWSWLGVVTNLLSAFFLTPYVISKLGADGYGLWIVIFSLVGYYGIVDLGFRPALVYYSGYFRARNQPQKINELICTVLVYYTAAAALLMGIALLVSRYADRLFQVPPAYYEEFSAVLILTGISWSIGINPFGAALEGHQRFDMTSRIYLITVLLRVFGSVLVLALGYRLFALVLSYVCVQLFGYTLCYLGLRRAFPALRLSFRYASFSTLREVSSYGVHSFVVGIGYQLLSQTAPLIVGLFRPAADIGYFGLPQRLLQNATDLVFRAGSVTNAKATELAAKDDRQGLIRLAIYANRYCFMLLIPLAIFLLVYGREIIYIWVGAEFVRNSSPLLPVLLSGIILVTGGQFNSSNILFSLQKNKEYGRSLILEAVLSAAAIALLTPHYGIMGAAWGVVIPMLLIRGLFTAWLVCSTVSYSLPSFLADIYVRPILTALPVYALAYAAKSAFLPGDNLLELIPAGVLIAALYFGTGLFTCTHPGHRQLFREITTSTWARVTRAVAF